MPINNNINLMFQLGFDFKASDFDYYFIKGVDKSDFLSYYYKALFEYK